MLALITVIAIVLFFPAIVFGSTSSGQVVLSLDRVIGDSGLDGMDMFQPDIDFLNDAIGPAEIAEPVISELAKVEGTEPAVIEMIEVEEEKPVKETQKVVHCRRDRNFICCFIFSYY